MESGYRGNRRQGGMSAASPHAFDCTLARRRPAGSFRKIAACVAALLVAAALEFAAAAESSPTVVELESPLSAAPPLQGLVRQPASAGPSPAVVLLHACNGNWRGLDERWGKRIVSWGYVTLTVDSFGPRGIRTACGSVAVDMGSDAYRALAYLARQPSVDPARVAVVGFSLGASLALTAVERGAIERASARKICAPAPFYPPRLAFKDNMKGAGLVLVGGSDDLEAPDEGRHKGGGP